MPVSLFFGDRQSYQINESRVNRMMSSDRAEATHMGLWDRFKDLFRSDKKSEALNELYNLLHSDNKTGFGPIATFNKLSELAGEGNENIFQIKLDNNCEDIVFFMDGKKICTKNYIDTLKDSCFENGEKFLKDFKKEAFNFSLENEELFHDFCSSIGAKKINLENKEDFGFDEIACIMSFFLEKSEKTLDIRKFYDGLDFSESMAETVLENFDRSDNGDDENMEIKSALNLIQMLILKKK
ncbi:hypothetical protein ACET8U_23065 [Aeromonas veronii]